MTEYIERERLLQDVRTTGNQPWSEWETAGVIDVINKLPAADVAEVKHGKWIYEEIENSLLFWLNCSVCGRKSLDQSVNIAYHYCPNCGAKMDLEG